MKKLGIMQPYFLPYIGYWQLLNAVDEFVLYDNIQYTKKGWFNRNRFLKNGTDDIFTIPLKKDSDYLDVCKRYISNDFNPKNLYARFQNAYAKAPFKKETLLVLESILNFDNENLFEYIYNSIKIIADYLDIKTPITISSIIDIDHSLKGQDKVLAICSAQKAGTYINSIGGVELYDKNVFLEHGIELNFIKSKNVEYKQFDNLFVPWLSIIDVMMFNSKAHIKDFLNAYELV